jgi:hypothetical protein
MTKNVQKKKQKKLLRKWNDLAQSHQLRKMTLRNRIDSVKSIYTVETEGFSQTNGVISSKAAGAAGYGHNAASIEFCTVN